ncbi:MAG: IS1634 family transposase, partial [Thiobacillaceae bacterium]
MFLRCKTRKKDGKTHRYWSVVENCRTKHGKVVQRHVLYLGEINDAQRSAWCKTIEVLEGANQRASQVAIFPEDRQA